MTVISLEKKVHTYYQDPESNIIRNIGTEKQPLFLKAYPTHRQINLIPYQYKQSSWHPVSQRLVENSRYCAFTLLPKTQNLNLIIYQGHDFIDFDFVTNIRYEDYTDLLIADFYQMRVLFFEENQKKSKTIQLIPPELNAIANVYFERFFKEKPEKLTTITGEDNCLKELKKRGFSFLIDKYNQKFGRLS